MDSRQSTVAIAGVGLVAVNYWTSNQRTAIVGTIWDKKAPADAHRALVGIAGELLLVGILTLFAGTDAGSTAALAALAALWILWGINYYTRGAGSASSLVSGGVAGSNAGGAGPKK